jgi:hypothetical protein
MTMWVALRTTGLILLTLTLLTLSPFFTSGCSAASGCCKVCTTGKACGNSCIARHLTCHKGPGCACNASVPSDPMLVVVRAPASW